MLLVQDQGGPSLHIVLVTPSYAPRFGGMETAVARLARELRQAGHHVTVIVNRYPRHLARFERIDGVPVYRILFPAPFVPRLEWRRTSWVRFFLLLPLTPWAALRLWLLLHSLRADVVNVHYLSAASTLYVGLLSRVRLISAAVVVSCHGSDLATAPSPSGSPTVSRWVLASAHAVTACSADLARYVYRLSPRIPGGGVRVVYNGTDVEECIDVAPLARPRPYIFTAGRLVEKKGMRVLVEAMAVLRERGVDCELIVAGSGPEEGRLRALVERLGLHGRVQFEGTAGGARLTALYRGCAVFALASTWEAFGIVALEAMACARAVVTTRAGGVEEIVVDGETGLLARPADPVDLAEKLASLLDDPRRAAEMGRRGRERVIAHFTWPCVAARYLDSYRSSADVEGAPRHRSAHNALTGVS